MTTQKDPERRWPLTGRAALLSRAQAELGGREGRGVVLAGYPTVGRTRLLQELVRAWPDGATTHWLSATETSRGIPFGVLGPHAPGHPGRPDTWLDAFLGRFEEPTRTLLAVDDAQLLDDHTALLVSQVVADGRVRVACTVRRDHPAPAAIVDLWKDGPLVRLDVPPLTREESDDLVAAALGGPVESALLERLWYLSRGSPLFLRDLVVAAHERGHLGLRDGLWVADGELEASAQLVDLSRETYESASDAERRVVAVLAVGEPLPVDVLDAVADPETVAFLERRGAVRCGTDGRYRLSVPALGVTLRSVLPRSEVRRTARALVDAVTDPEALEDPDLRRYAAWTLDAARSADPMLLLRAAKAARRAYDLTEAERLARAASEAGGAARPGASLLLGDVLVTTGQAEEAARVFEAIDVEAATDEEIAEAAGARSQLLYFPLERPLDAIQSLVQAATAVRSDRTRGRVQASQALYQAMIGDLQQSITLSDTVLGRAETSHDDRTVATTALAFASVMAGDLPTARRAARLGLEMVRDAGVRAARTSVLLRLVALEAELYGGSPRETLKQAEETYAGMLQRGLAPAAALFAVLVAQTRLLTGDIEGSSRAATEAEQLLAEGDLMRLRPQAASTAAIAAATAGDLHRGRDALKRATAMTTVEDARTRAQLERARVTVLAAEGQLEKAALRAHDGGMQLAEMEHLTLAGCLLHEATRAGYPGQVVAPLTAIAAEVGGDRLAKHARHAAALAEEDAAKLEAVGDAYLEGGALLDAAETFAQAAETHARQQRAGRANLLRARAGSVAARCTGVSTPALAGLVTEPMTRREREIALLAARGSTSREIATALVLSPRTVDNHLASVYRKLGIGGRHELSTALAADAGGDG